MTPEDGGGFLCGLFYVRTIHQGMYDSTLGERGEEEEGDLENVPEEKKKEELS